MCLAMMCTPALSAPPHYRVIVPDGVELPIGVLESGTVVYASEAGGFSAWTPSGTETWIEAGHALQGLGIGTKANLIDLACTSEGTLFLSASTWNDSGFYARTPDGHEAWWLRRGESLGEAGRFQFTLWPALAVTGPKSCVVTVITDSGIQTPDGYFKGGAALLSLVADDGGGDPHIEIIAQAGDRTPDGTDVFLHYNSDHDSAFQYLCGNARGQVTLITRVFKAETNFFEPRWTLWRWSKESGLQRLLDPEQLVGDKSYEPDFMCLSPAGTICVVARDADWKSSVLVFDGPNGTTPRIAAWVGEELPEGRILTIEEAKVNDRGSILFSGFVVPREGGREQLMLFHRTASGVTQTVASPLWCHDARLCGMVPAYGRASLTNDELIVFNVEADDTGRQGGFYAFDGRAGGDAFPRAIVAPRMTVWPSATWPWMISASPPGTIAANSAGRVALFTVGVGSMAVFDPRIEDCVSDLNGDSLVDTTDFELFLGQYDVLNCTDSEMPSGCSADANGDEHVDDADFMIFALAYSNGACPGLEE